MLAPRGGCAKIDGLLIYTVIDDASGEGRKLAVVAVAKSHMPCDTIDKLERNLKGLQLALTEGATVCNRERTNTGRCASRTAACASTT